MLCYVCVEIHKDLCLPFSLKLPFQDHQVPRMARRDRIHWIGLIMMGF